ncbi:LamG-like jellyroll fold domain-containing protein [Sporocytophaga myxococcoides]|uniref:LamG-like jellyroll fold domain-containing protein n=1 Tax=Sporocytophaga myxococcoides TaxID=153721 RepID=UPI00041C86D1|nr:LamG-like jellyroll fold domain-containing protein [Sporocytophaga myxococcoides]
MSSRFFSIVKKALVVLAGVCTIPVIGQDGPGGVGGSGYPLSWYKADDLNLSDNATVSSWAAHKGDRQMITPSGQSVTSPKFSTNGFASGIGSVYFENTNYLEENLGHNLQNSHFIFVAFKSTAFDKNLIGISSPFPSESSAIGDRRFICYRQNGPANIIFATDKYSVCASDAAKNLALTGNNSSTPNILYLARLPKVGNNVSIEAGYNGNSTDGENVDYLQSLSCYNDHVEYDKLTIGRGDYLGYVAEVVSFENINSAQKKIVENYLSSKYAIAVANDYYGLETGFNKDVAGIGKDADGSLHTSSKSDIMSMTGNFLQFGSFAFVGRNNVESNNLLANDDPNQDNPPFVKRMLKTWRIDLTGTTGILDFSIWNKSNLTVLPGQRPVMLIDSDGDFSDGNGKIMVMEDNGNGGYVVNGLTLNDNDYISFGVLDPGSCPSFNAAKSFFGKTDNYDGNALNSSGLEISNPRNLENKEYLGLAADNIALDYSVAVASTDFLRTTTTWCVSEVGEVGGVDITINPADFPALPSNFRSFNILVYYGENTTSPNKIIDLVKEGNVFKAYNVNLDQGNKIAIGIDVLAYSKVQTNTDYLFFNHLPGTTVFSGLSSAVNTVRVDRVWQYKSNGSSGLLNFYLPAEKFTLLPYQKLAMLIDSDGNFSSGAVVHVMDLVGADYTASNVSIAPDQFVTFAVLNQYTYSTDFSGDIKALGKADINYDVKSLISSGLRFEDFSEVEAQRYLLVGNNGGSIELNNSNAPLSGKRTSLVWKVKEYGETGKGVIYFHKSVFEQVANKDFVLLVDKVKEGNAPDGDFSDAEVYGMVREGDFYKAYYIPLSDGELVAVGAIGHVVTHDKVTSSVLKESASQLSNVLLANSTIVPRQVENFEFAHPCIEKVKRAELQVTFNTGKFYKLGGEFTDPAKVDITIEGFKDFTSSTPSVTYTTSITIDLNQPEKLFYQEITKDLEVTGIKLYKIKVTDFDPSANTLVNGQLEVETKVIIENEMQVPVTIGAIVHGLKVTGTSIKKFEWVDEHCAAPLYQFQLLKLFNESSVSTSEYVVNASVDWSKALTLETSQHDISLTMVEGTGFYAWRVRPIGNTYEGGVANSRNWGTWSTADIDIPSTISLSCNKDDQTSCLEDYKGTVFYYKQFDDELNFIYSRTFTENTGIHESISYANGLLQVKQNQVKVPSNGDASSTGKIIVNQTVYDYSGRPALNSMPAPVMDDESALNKNEFGYKESFLTNSGNLYGASNFDADDKISNPDPVTGGPLNTFYSDGNADKTIPNAEGYPYSRSIFQTGSGKVIEEGSVGDKHRIRIENDHTVKMSVGNASEQELIRLFGDEAPNAGTVLKSTITDENKVVSVTFTDKSGKIIATGVSKGGVTNLDALTIDELVVEEVLKDNKKYGEHGLISSKELTFTEATEVEFDYEITPEAFSAICGGTTICTSCAYKLTIKITDLDDPDSDINQEVTKLIPSLESCSTAAAIDDILTFTSLTFPPGHYQIDKVIEMDVNAANTYAERVAEIAGNGLQQYVDEIKNRLESGNIESLNSYLQGLMAGTTPGLVVEGYNELGESIAKTASFDNGYEVALTTSCCSIRIPIIIIPLEPCENPDINGPNNLGPYMLSELGKIKDKNGIPYNIARLSNNEYDAAKFNQLIENMRSEVGTETDPVSGDPIPMFTCEDLINCWLGILQTLETNSSTGKSKGLSTENLAITEPDNNTGAGIPEWATGNTAVNSPQLPSSVEQFLDCAGRHYIGFVENAQQHKIYAYKYFKYTLHDNPACENIFCNVRNADINNPVLLEEGAPGYKSPCNQQMCLFNQVPNGNYYQIKVENATPGQFDLWEGEHPNYMAFAMCIKSSSAFGSGEDLDPEKVKESLLKNKVKLETECQSSCEDKYEQFMAALISVYPSDGSGHYRKPDQSLLNYEDLCCTARNLVEYCKDQCQLTIVKTDCEPLYEDLGEDKVMRVGTKEEMDKIQAIMFGKFELQPTDASSNTCMGLEDFNRNDLCQVAAFSFTNNAEDISGNGHNGTLSNVTTGADKNNNASSAYEFTGSGSSYIDAGTNFNFYQEFTVASWIKTTGLNEQYIISRENAVENKGFHLKILPGGEAAFEGRDGSGVLRTSEPSVGGNLMDGNWHFLAGVYNKGAYQIWIDGKLKEEKRFPGTDGDFNCTSSLVIGRNANMSGTPYNFQGTIDQVQIFECAFDQTRINELYSEYYFEDKRKTPDQCLIPDHFKIYPEYFKSEVSFEKPLKQDVFESFEKGSDGSLLTGGVAFNDNGATYGDFQLQRLDPQLNIIWQKAFGGSHTDWGYSVDEINLNGRKYAVIAGASSSVPESNGNIDPSFIKQAPNYGALDGYVVVADYEDGSYVKELSFGGSVGDRIYDIQKGNNCFFLAGASGSAPVNISGVGNKTSPAYGSWDGWLIKLDQNFNKISDVSFGGAGDDFIYKIIPSNDGGYFLVGFSDSQEPNSADPLDIPHGRKDGWVIKVNADLSLVWKRRYGLDKEDIFYNATISEDNNLVVSGSSMRGDASSSEFDLIDLWIVKIDQSDGDIIWEKTFGNPSRRDVGFNMQLNTSIKRINDGYVVVSAKMPNAAVWPEWNQLNYRSDGWILKLDFQGNFEFDKVIDRGDQLDLNGLVVIDDYNFIASGVIELDVSSPNAPNAPSYFFLPFGLASNKQCTPQKICIRWIPPVLEVTPPEDEEVVKQPKLKEIVVKEIKNKLELQLGKCKLNNMPERLDEYNNKCLNSVINDNLTISYKIKQGHYTLYYYDRAGNLVKTVPPAGVVPVVPSGTATAVTRQQETDHKLKTKYKYNSLGQLTEQETPDGGITKFVYNDIGQLRYSQNAQQLVDNKYSYTKYDNLGRVTEVGQANLSAPTTLGQLNASDMTWPSTGTSNSTHTVYTSEAAHVNYLGEGQRYLRNRVSYTYTYNSNGERAVTYYSYDPHGNVEWIVQEIPGIGKNTIAYEYDLISNKVLKVKYNETLSDQFFHKYSYDADNRITEVFTSKDGRIWDKDAAYKYYLHGPLKRTEIGEDKIQGVDYVYTLQGWLKGVNTPNLDATQDPGGDGLAGSEFQKDEYGMMLGYYGGDFNRTGSVFSSVAGNTYDLSSSDKDLFNGNISSWTSRIEQEYRDYSKTEGNSGIAPEKFTTGQKFQYDQLNRIKQSDFYSYDATTGQFENKGITGVAEAYKTKYTYDPNGNIITLDRNGDKADAALPMDRLTYSYKEGKNQLRHVKEASEALTGSYTEDIESQDDDNYEYDAIGNLTHDKFEKINITWNVYGKIATISPSEANTVKPKPYITFAYDAAGNRIKKEQNRAPYNGNNPSRDPVNITTTYYVRDASGNTMAVYKRENELFEGNYYHAKFTLIEQSIYGSSRLGLFEPNTLVATVLFHKDDMDKVTLENSILERVSKNKNLLTVSHQKETLTNSLGSPVNITLSNLYKISNGTSVAPFGNFGGTGNFAGKVKNNISSVETQTGTLQIVSVTPETYFGNTGACLVYDADGLLMPNSDNVLSDAKTQSVIVKRPGKDNLYYLVTANGGKLYYHVIDLAQNGNGVSSPKGDVVSKNNLLDADVLSNKYTGAFQAVEDYSTGKTYIYATEYVPGAPTGVLRLLQFEITDKDVISQQPVVIAVRPAVSAGGFSEMQISSDGKKLALYNHKNTIGWFDHQDSEILVFNLGYDYKVAENDLVNSLVIPVGESFKGASVEFSEDNRLLYYTRNLTVNYPFNSTNSADFLSRYEFRNGNTADVQNGVYGDLRRSGNRLFLSNRNADGISRYFENSTGQSTADAQLNVGLTGSKQSGIFPLQNHRIYTKADLTNIVGRYVDRKVYELSDHLGNVTVTFSDRLETEISGSTLTNSVGIRTYSNYYAFGMQMPGRSHCAKTYRYGFNGKEKDGEWNSGGAMYDYGFRIYDPRIAKFFSVDPLTGKYPYYTPYQFAGNKPIFCVDVDGLEDSPSVERNADMAAGKAAGMTTEESVQFHQESNQARATGAKLGIFTGGIIFSGGVGLTYLRNNWVEIIHDPTIPIEIAAFIYNLLGGEDMPFPARPAAPAAGKVSQAVDDVFDSKLLFAIKRDKSHVLVGVQKQEDEVAKWIHQIPTKETTRMPITEKPLYGPGKITGPRDIPNEETHIIYEIPITQKQADVGEALMRDMKGPNTYNIYNRSCVTCAKNVIEGTTGAPLKNANIFSITPEGMERLIQTQYAPGRFK